MIGRPARFLALSALAALALSACGGGGGGGYDGGGGGISTPIPTATAQPGFTCPASDTTFGTSRSTASDVRRAVQSARSASPSTSSTLLAVTYRTTAIAKPAVAIDARVASAGARFVKQTTFARIGRATRVLSVNPSDLASAQAALRSQPGIIDAAPVRRLHTMTTSPFLTNDPYFRGQPGTSAPLYQTGSTAGQWDMHVIGLEHAFAYSQPGNGSGIVNAGALGSTNVKLAIIDTGEDVTQPDLSGDHIVRTQCFLTDDNGTQSVSSYVTDPQGHGTDVTGLAAADTNNGYGFAGDGGNVSLLLYRVFPTPDDSCTNTKSTDPRCGATDVDVADAIDDAVSYGANVINLSLGIGENCTSGQDPDATEGSAIANAIANNVIVVAASGNAGGSGVEAPGCDPGVIAAGASAYNDGQPNGAGYTGANTEYVASYSQYGTTNVPKDSASWGIVAPGGDATGSTDPDNLHWIENVWTSTPYDSNFAGFCGIDAFGESNNCRTLINGTSMSSAHVAGAAALVLSVAGTNSAYATPTAMFRLLCTTADDIGDSHEGCGRLNVYRAVATAVGDVNLP
jgi:subtilisin family serine protease